MITVYENPWFRVVKDGKFHYIQENGSDNGAIVLVRDEQSFIFVHSRRPAQQGAVLVEAPRGYGAPGETSLAAAARELLEETGYRAAPEQFEKLGTVRPNSAILSAVIDVYAVQVRAEQKVAETDTEVEGLVYIAVDDLHREVAQGRISDGMTLSALSLYWARQAEEV